MADLNFIGPSRKGKILFEEGPVYNFICSLSCINHDLDGLIGWIPEQKKTLSQEMLLDTDVYSLAAVLLLKDKEDSVEEFFSYLRNIDAEEISRREYKLWVERAEKYLPGSEIPSYETLASDKAVYCRFGDRLHNALGADCCTDYNDRSYRKYTEPAEFKKDMIAFLDFFWEEVYREEWNSMSSQISRSVQAFRSLDFSARPLADAFREIIDRDEIPESFSDVLDGKRDIVFVPSPHIGPYLLGIYYSDAVVKIMIRARTPEGATVRDLDMERSEVYSQLAGLADNTRLQILRMASDGNYVTTQIVMDSLGLSQSSASRHLNQLTSVGLLSVNPQERVKHYRLSHKKIDSTFKLLKDFLRH